MKYLRYILAISLLAAPIVAEACFHPWNWYNSTSLFRLVEPSTSEEASQRQKNCRGWQELTSNRISLYDIEEIVYTMSVEEYEKFYATPEYYGNNDFARWIKRYDRAIADYLLLAKRNEKMRFEYSSAWYYPTMKIGGPVTLEEIIETSLSNTDPRLRSRYLLQAIRALTTLKEYDKCIELWTNEASLLGKEDVMYKHIYPYIAGAYYHTGDVDKAMAIFASMGDVSSMKYIAKQQHRELTEGEIITHLYNNGVPLAKYEGRISRLVIKAENYPTISDYNDKPVVNKNLRTIRDIALEAGANTPHGDNAKWYYIAAYILTEEQRFEEAQRTLAKSKAYPCSEWMEESIEVLNIWLDAATSRLDEEYEARLVGQLKWLSSKFEEYLTPEMREMLSSEYIVYYYDAYYWKETFPRIIYITLAPRYIEKGDNTRALQLANFASNNMYHIIDTINYDYWDKYYKCYYNCEDSIDIYRRNKSTDNKLDYSNEFFAMINNMPADAAKAYVERVAHPVSEFDKYVNSRGYTYTDYLNDIVGTLYLREMRYKEAEEYLAKVSCEYGDMLNVSLTRDPFTINCEYTGTTIDFRYMFAHKMASLERSMELTSDNDRYATYAVEYGLGLYNSFDRCWALTHYHYGWLGGKFTPWDRKPENIARLKRGRDIIRDALSKFENKELAAAAYYKLQNYRIVGTRYGNTKYGRIVEHSCDHLVDYNAHLAATRARL